MLVGDARRRWSSASKVLSTLGGSGGSRVHLTQPVEEDLVDVRRTFFLYPMSAARYEVAADQSGTWLAPSDGMVSPDRLA
jgi:hypothetical protein